MKHAGLTPCQSAALSARLAPAVALLTPLEQQTFEAEHHALDLLHTALRHYPAGVSPRKLADLTGLAVGYVHEVLKRSESVLKRRDRHPHCWWADWSDVEPSFRPRGRPKKEDAVKLPERAAPVWAWEI